MALVERVKKILTTPNTEWPVIAGESTGTAELYTGYVMPLAAIGPIAIVLGNIIAGSPVSFMASVALAIVSFVLALVAVYVLALIVAKIAPSFGGKDDMAQALKLVAYAYTASWLGGIFNLISALSLLGIIAALYGLYLLYTGTVPLMGVPKERSGGYTAVVVLVAIGVYIVIGIVVGSIVAAVVAVK
jgi:hypothetical protein